MPGKNKPVEVPKILQDYQGPHLRDYIGEGYSRGKEYAIDWRKRTSSKVARVALAFTFSKKDWGLNDVNSNDDLEKRQQDRAWATYEDNMRETHINTGIERGNERIAKAKELGALAMVLTGFDKVVDLADERAGMRAFHRKGRQAYIARNGTMKSHMRESYVNIVNNQRSKRS